MIISQKDNKYQLLLLKSHKLASAMYLITKFLTDKDPLKWQLRKLSLKICSAFEPVDLSGAIKDIGQILSLIDIALNGEAVSKMNFLIIKQEYLGLRSSLLSEQNKYNPLNQISSPALYLSGPNLRSQTLENSNKEPELASPVLTRQAVPAMPGRRGDEEQRQDLILKFIKEKGWSSIRDIAKAIPQVSSKTVQRALVDMVRIGMLKKEGERRWSRYHLLTPEPS